MPTLTCNPSTDKPNDLSGLVEGCQMDSEILYEKLGILLDRIERLEGSQDELLRRAGLL